MRASSPASSLLPRTSWPGLCAALSLAVLAASGFGGGGSKPAAAPTAPAATASTPASPKTAAPKPRPARRAAARYERQMQVLGGKLSAYFASIGRANMDASRKQAVANIEHVQARLRDAAVKLAAMKPPAEIRPQQQRLIDAVQEYANELDGIIAQLKAGNRAALATIPQLRGIRDMGKATEAITRARYDIIGSGAPSG